MNESMTDEQTETLNEFLSFINEDIKLK